MRSLLVVLLLFPFIGLSQSDSLNSKTYDVGEFTGVKVRGYLRVFLHPADQPSVVIQSEKDIDFEEMSVEVDEGVLELTIDKGDYKLRVPEIHVYYTIIDKIRAFGHATVTYDETKETRAKESLELSVQAGAGIHLKVDCKSLSAQVSQGGRITLKGHADDFECQINTGGTIAAKQMVAKKIVAKVKAGGEIFTNHTESLEAKTFSGGKIYYLGDPSTVKEKTVGGKVINLNEKKSGQ